MALQAILHSVSSYSYSFGASKQSVPTQFMTTTANRLNVLATKKSSRQLRSIPLLATRDKEELSENVKKHKPRLPERVVNTYVDYATRLWRETDPVVRKKIAAEKAISAIKRVEHIMKGEEYVDLGARDGDNIDTIEKTAAE